MKKITIVLVLVLVFVNSLGIAKAESGDSVVGFGASTCGDWMTGRNFKSEKVDSLFEAWLQGYLSGLNVQRVLALKEKEMVVLPSMYTIFHYIDEACKKDSLQATYVVAAKLFKDLEKKQGLSVKN